MGGNTRAEAQDKHDFSEFNRKIFNFHQWLGTARFTVEKSGPDGGGGGSLRITAIPLFNMFIFGAYYVNSVIKIIYLFLVLVDGFGPVQFLDRIALTDYFLCGVMIIPFGRWIWSRALHEVICQFWTLEHTIFELLGSPRKMLAEMEEKHWRTIYAHLTIVGLGCGSLALQFYADPKNCAFTYSIIGNDNALLRLIFCAHEVTFMGHAWFCNAGVNSMVTMMADGICVTLGGMNSVVDDEVTRNSGSKSARKKCDIDDARITQLIQHLQRLSMTTRIFNREVANKLAGLIMIGYVQYVSSTCMAFQVIRKENGGLGDIWFYLQDCIISGYHCFRAFNHISQVQPLAKEVYHSMRSYEAVRRISTNSSSKFQNLRLQLAWRKMSLKIGAVRITRITVLNSMQSLIGYYLCVALW